MEREQLLNGLMDLVREDRRPALRRKIQDALDALPQGGPEHEANQARYLTDLGILARWRGPDFIYSRGIAETLRVDEEFFELAYAIKRAMP